MHEKHVTQQIQTKHDGEIEDVVQLVSQLQLQTEDW
jgi:hypothetical protein